MTQMTRITQKTKSLESARITQPRQKIKTFSSGVPSYCGSSAGSCVKVVAVVTVPVNTATVTSHYSTVLMKTVMPVDSGDNSGSDDGVCRCMCRCMLLCRCFRCVAALFRFVQKSLF